MKNFEFNGEIICVGSINMDLVMNVERFSKPGETLLARSFDTFPGGKGGNQAVAASKLGGQVIMLSRLGDDDFSQKLNDSLNSNGVNTDYIIEENGNTSGIAMITVDKNGQNSISIFPGCNENFSPEDIRKNESIFSAGRTLLINMEIPIDTVYETIKLAKKNGMFVILDPAPAPKQAIPAEVINCVDIVKPNETEAEIITGISVNDRSDAVKALNKLKEMGFSLPMVTMGKKGVMALLNEEIIEVESYKVKAVDTTAAGDVFSGGLTARLVSGCELKDAMKFASASAAISATRKGAQSSVPDKSEVMEFMNS